MEIVRQAHELLDYMKMSMMQADEAEERRKYYFEEYNQAEDEYNELKAKAPELMELLEKQY